MDFPYLSLVVKTWNTVRNAPSCVPVRTQTHKPTLDELLIEVETNEARATIVARESNRSLQIRVQRFKAEVFICDDSSLTKLAVKEKLVLLCNELSASPFA